MNQVPGSPALSAILPIECPGDLFSVGVCGLFKHAQHANARAFGRHESFADRRVVGTVHTTGTFCRVPQRKSGLGNRGRQTTHSRAFQIPGGAKYILAPGDVVTVTVWGHPELSGKRTIGPDGDIQLPFVGSFKSGRLQRR